MTTMEKPYAPNRLNKRHPVPKKKKKDTSFFYYKAHGLAMTSYLVILGRLELPIQLSQKKMGKSLSGNHFSPNLRVQNSKKQK